MFGKTIELGGITGISAGLATGSGITALSSGALSITPTAFAKLATNPKATKALTLGLTKNRGTVRIAPIAARLINLLNEDARNEQLAILKERKKQRRERQGKQFERGQPTLQQLRGLGGGRRF